MKIRQIRFRNINSFYGEHDPIQFTNGVLATTGLFVISGPTGAGKSTLLDVITLALFNRIPRLSGIVSNTMILNEGLIVNQQAMQEPNTAAFAEIEYEVTGQVYRSRWSIKKNRNGNWNNYEMEVAHLPEDQTTGTLFPIKNLADFPKKNEELIGLTYEQFIRSIVLAQGAFDHFLKARAAERSKMLEKITGTEIYRQLSQRAFAESKQFDTQIDTVRQAVSLIHVLDDEVVKELKIQQKSIDADLEILDKNIDRYTSEQQLLKIIAEAERSLAILSTRRQQLEEQVTHFASDAHRLERHATVADLTDNLTHLRTLENQHTNFTKQQTAATEALKALGEELNEVLVTANTLTKQVNLTGESLESVISAFREQVLSLEREEQVERDNGKRPLLSAQKTIDSVSEGELRKLNLRDIEAALEQACQLQKTVTDGINLLSGEYATITPDTFQHELDRLVERTTEYGQLVSLLEEQQKRLAEGMELKAKAEGIETDVLTKTQVVTQLEAELNELELKKSRLEQEQRRLETEANLDELRKGLQSGAPCPLCGSLSHPYAQHYVQKTGEVALKLRLVTDDWDKKRKEHDTAHRVFVQAQSDLTAFNTYRDQLRHDFKNRKAELSEKLASVTLDPDIQPTELRNIIKLLNLQRQDLGRLQSLWQQRDLLQRLLSDLDLVRSSTKRADELRATRNALYKGTDIRSHCDKLISQFTTIRQRMANQQTLLTKASSDLTACQQQLDELNGSLLPVLHKRGFADAISARACLLDSTAFKSLQDTQIQLQKDADDIARRTEEETIKRNDAQANRKETASLIEIEIQLKALKDKQRLVTENVGYLRKQLEQDQAERKRQQKLRKTLTEAEQKAQPWRELARLIGSAKGDEYSKFAQGLTLSQLIGLSNRRLRELTDRYLLLKPRDGQDELYVVDQYQGNAERSVSSLSGGETFTLSLSLALGLSDLASQNVQINSLFIDEGFGTLDPESLDTAIVMLEKLQHDSQKTIGIISHRHEIKERISVQIQVEKGNDGNSKLKVTELV